jgi:hypothetical protein
VSALKEMFSALRAEGKREEECINVIAERLGENPVEARRLLVDVAHVKLGGKGDRRRGSTAGNGKRPAAPQLDTAAVQAAYRTHREAGKRADEAVKAVAREHHARPHDVRPVCGTVEFALREAEA